MQPNLLHTILDVGHRIAAAIERQDLEAYLTLVPLRKQLIEQLSAYTHPAEIDPEWERMIPAFVEQDNHIAAHLAVWERDLAEDIHAVRRMRHAQQRYQPPAAPRRLLNKRLQG